MHMLRQAPGCMRKQRDSLHLSHVAAMSPCKMHRSGTRACLRPECYEDLLAYVARVILAMTHCLGFWLLLTGQGAVRAHHANHKALDLVPTS